MPKVNNRQMGKNSPDMVTHPNVQPGLVAEWLSIVYWIFRVVSRIAPSRNFPEKKVLFYYSWWAKGHLFCFVNATLTMRITLLRTYLPFYPREGIGTQ
jgi:hypothetical protein